MGISVGMVGLGQFGRCFADLFKAHPAVDRIALCDREPDRVAAFASRPTWKDKFNPRDAYCSLDDICKADLDALVIITQPWLHAPQCIQAMEAGKHVYSAVPLISIPDNDEILEWCDKLVETVKRTGRHYMLGETTFYHAYTMFCRRKAAEGAFGSFVYAEGEYYHPFDSPNCDLRDVLKARLASRAGKEWVAVRKRYADRGIVSGPMHYPTHSTSGPVSVMNAHAVKVCCFGQKPATRDPYFRGTVETFSNETALFQMSNGAAVRIGEHRECALGRETFRIYGTRGAYENDTWITKEEMRDPLPAPVLDAFRKINPDSDAYGGHGGSHAYLVNEFVDAVAHNRTPAINVWESARYMAMGVMAHKSALRDGEVLNVPDWGDAPGRKARAGAAGRRRHSA